MTDLLDDFVRARVEPIRDQLWAHGEITIAGLRRLDKALGIETYSRGNETANQCDESVKRKYSLSELFCAAQECTGLTMPGMWEPTGEMHLSGRCGCSQSTKRYREASE